MNRKVRFAALIRLTRFFFATAILIFFLFSCKEHKTISDNDTAIDNALNYIADAQTIWGGFPTERCLGDAMGHCINDKTLFVPVLIGLCLHENHNEKAKAIHKRLGAMLVDQQGENGAWEFYLNEPNESRRFYFPDLDDTVLIGCYLLKNGVSFNMEVMKQAIRDNREGSFYLTFLREHQAPPPQTGNIDPVVNAQVMMMTGEQDAAVCAFVNETVANKPLPSIYYRDRVIMWYMLSRAYANGVGCIRKSIEQLSKEAIASQDSQGSLGTPLRTAAFITAAFNSGVTDYAAIGKATAYLLRTQSKDGSWPSGFFFHGGDPNFFYGSRALTTAIVVEALEKSRSVSIK